MNLNIDIFRIETNHVAPEKGRILIAEPFLPGSYFNRSIVLLVSYSKQGAVGFILNKKVDYPIDELVAEFPDFESQLYIGGPVGTDSIFFIHSLGEAIPGSLHIVGNLYWGGDFEVLKQQIRLGLVSSGQVRFFLGYSGWDAGQLDEEIRENSWLVAESSEELVLKAPNEKDLWLETVKQLGGKYSLWENFPENPSLN
jgi:putative transcriptional regulator